MILKDKKEVAARRGFAFEEGAKQSTMGTHVRPEFPLRPLLQALWLSRHLDIWATVSADNISLSVLKSGTTWTTSIDFTQYSYSILNKIYHFLHLIFSKEVHLTNLYFLSLVLPGRKEEACWINNAFLFYFTYNEGWGTYHIIQEKKDLICVQGKCSEKQTEGPWTVRLSCLAVVLQTKGSPVQFPVRHLPGL